MCLHRFRKIGRSTEMLPQRRFNWTTRDAPPCRWNGGPPRSRLPRRPGGRRTGERRRDCTCCQNRAQHRGLGPDAAQHLGGGDHHGRRSLTRRQRAQSSRPKRIGGPRLDRAHRRRVRSGRMRWRSCSASSSASAPPSPATGATRPSRTPQSTPKEWSALRGSMIPRSAMCLRRTTSSRPIAPSSTSRPAAGESDPSSPFRAATRRRYPGWALVSWIGFRQLGSALVPT